MSENKLYLPAEWAPQSAVQLTFPHEQTDWADMLPLVLPIFGIIASTISRYEKVIVVCKDREKVMPYLQEARTSNLILVELDSNDTWARDHGGITVLADKQPLVLDFMFNGWGLKFAADKDNLLTALLKQQGIFKAPVRPGGLVLEGGGLESDGQGTLLTTTECLLSPNRNPHFSQAEIEAQLKVLFGLERVLWLHHGYLAGDDTDSHIDTLARFCSPDTIAYVKCDDPDDEHFEALRRMEEDLKSFRMLNGDPYQLAPLPWPKACYAQDGHRLPATYANFLIINGAVLVPLYDMEPDEDALQLFQQLFPTRDIIGINCRPIIEQHGSLHCLTMQYPEGVV